MAAGRGSGLMFGVLALLGAAFVARFVYTLIEDFQTQLDDAQRPEETVEVVVAGKDLLPGLTVQVEDLNVVRLPDAYIPDEAFRRKEEVIDRVARDRILEGEFIREERLADPEAGYGMNAIIPQGMRAFAINISSGSAVSGFINPGNFVDIIVTFPDAVPPKSITLLQAIAVLAVDDRITETVIDEKTGRRRRVKPSVTLAITPQQAERLAHANDQGALTLTLRNDVDVTHLNAEGDEAQAFSEFSPIRPPVSPRRSSENVRVIHGGGASEVRVRSE